MSKHLNTRLTLIMGTLLLLFVFLFTSAFAFIFWQHAKKVEQARMETKLLNMADYMGRNYKGKNLTKSYGNKFFQLSNTLNEEIWLVDKDSLSLAGAKNYPQLKYDQLPPGCAKDIQQILAGNHIFSTNFQQFTNKLPLTVGIPITNNDKEVVGALLLHYQAPEFFDSWYDSLGIAIFTALIIYVLCLILIYYAVKKSTIPLAVFNKYLQRLIAGDYRSKLKSQGPEDYRLLAQDLNQLAAYLAHNQQLNIQDKLHTKSLLLNSGYANYQIYNRYQALLEEIKPYLAKYLPRGLAHNLFKLQDDFGRSTSNLFKEQAPDLLGFNFTQVNFLDIMKETLNKFQDQYHAKEITLQETNPLPEGIIALKADSRRLAQMLTIVLRLCLACLNKGQVLTIDYSQDPSRYIITITAPGFKDYNDFLGDNLHYLVARNLAHLQNLDLRYEPQHKEPCYRLILSKTIKFS